MKLRHGIALTVGSLAGSACVATDVPGEPHQSVAVGATILPIDPIEIEPIPTDWVTPCKSDPRVVVGAVSLDTCVGANLFFRETFSGNGRSCATCHPVDHNFTIDPPFIATLPPSDWLFVAEFNPDLAGLEKPEMMRKFSLILENLDGFDPDPRTRFVMRSVPHTLSLATSITRSASDPVTIPVDRTGWSGDGAPGNGALRDFQTGAIIQHYTRSLHRDPNTDFRLASDEELRTIDLYMRGVGRTNELTLANVVMSDARAEAGRAKFLSVGCNACHGNAGANASFGDGGNRNFNTNVELSRSPALAGFPLDGGFLTTANPDGSFGNRTFNTPPLIEAADTGPFFHTATAISGASAHNTDFAQTIEQAIAFYDSPAFNNGRPAPIELTAEEIDNIGRFLRGLNATFNAALALKRIDAELAIAAAFHDTQLGIQREMLRLAQVELKDALQALTGIPAALSTGTTTLLNSTAQQSFTKAIDLLETARSAAYEADRVAAATNARQLIVSASSSIGSNLTYTIGGGTVMF